MGRKDYLLADCANALRGRGLIPDLPLTPVQDLHIPLLRSWIRNDYRLANPPVVSPPSAV
jgi:hypothetical protein